MTQLKWWETAIIYQIYPRSFQDSNSDGIGDLPGITTRLEYIANLGVDAIWISPFYPSPQKDFGYDVSDYCDINPEYGSLADFDTLIAKAHGLGLKVMIDIVPGHCSDQHIWFEESRQSRDNPKADWFHWVDPLEDGSAPTNWLSFFGGRAWTWEPRRQQYYLHNFLPSQPNLNHANPSVIDAFWILHAFGLIAASTGFAWMRCMRSMPIPRPIATTWGNRILNWAACRKSSNHFFGSCMTARSSINPPFRVSLKPFAKSPMNTMGTVS